MILSYIGGCVLTSYYLQRLRDRSGTVSNIKNQMILSYIGGCVLTSYYLQRLRDRIRTVSTQAGCSNIFDINFFPRKYCFFCCFGHNVKFSVTGNRTKVCWERASYPNPQTITDNEETVLKSVSIGTFRGLFRFLLGQICEQ